MQLNIHEHHNTKKDDNYSCNTLQIRVYNDSLNLELKKKTEKEKTWEVYQNAFLKFDFVHSQGSARTQLPYYQKLRTRVTHIWGDRKSQPNRSAMERPRSGRTS